MKCFLIRQKLWYLIIIDATKPIQKEGEEADKFPERLEDWDSQNHLIITWFYNTSAPRGSFDTAKEVWDFLANRYIGWNLIDQYLLLQTLHRLKQEDQEPVYQLIANMNAVWDQLTIFEPTSKCTVNAEKVAAYKDHQLTTIKPPSAL